MRVYTTNDIHCLLLTYFLSPQIFTGYYILPFHFGMLIDYIIMYYMKCNINIINIFKDPFRKSNYIVLMLKHVPLF